MTRLRWPVAVTVTTLLLGATAILQTDNWNSVLGQTQSAADRPELARAYEVSSAFRDVSRNALPAVVSIKTTGRVVRQTVSQRTSPFDDPFFRQFFNERGFGEFDRRDREPIEREYRTPGGMGSGFIISSSGLVMTNAHVVADAEEVVVTLADGREFTAVDVKSDERSDVAVLRIETSEKLPFLQLGDDSEMEIGDWVLAFGSPFGLHQTVTQGIVSAKGRGLPGSSMPQEFLQTDAAINPGNSGGPLVNLRGEVIGINTAISTRSGGYDGVSLAVPISVAKWVGDQLADSGQVRRGYVGITMQEIDVELAPEFDLRLPRGVAVTGVMKGSPADQAGFRTGDVILEVDGNPISGNRNMLGVVERLRIGQTYRIRVQRDGRERDLRIKVAERPTSLAQQEEQTFSVPVSQDERAVIDELGVAVQAVTPEIAERLGVPSEGVVISSVARQSPAAKIGLEPRIVITRAGNREIESTSDLEQAVREARSRGKVLLLVKIPDGNSNISRFVTVPLSGGR